MRRLLSSILIIAFCAVASWAQTSQLAFGKKSTVDPADVLKVDYFSNANTSGAPDATVRLDNPNTAQMNICAYVFVFDSNQELSECCGCLLTPDGLRTLSVNTDLTSNPLTGVKLSTGAIKLFSVEPVANACPFPGTVSANQYFEPGLRGWATHIQNGKFAITETASQDATLSEAENLRAYNECADIGTVGSGAGVCTCGTGD